LSRIAKPIAKGIEIKKSFLQDEFDFSALKPFEEFCDYFLFDTKENYLEETEQLSIGVLKKYPSTKLFSAVDRTRRIKSTKQYPNLVDV
jgi:phosphoribosylanthranilate isomerase